MRKLRAIVRIVMIAVLTAAGVLLLLGGRLLALFTDTGFRRWRLRVFQGWARGLAAIIGMRLVVRGNAPPPPFFLVANHLSYMDILVLATQVRGVFVSRHDVSGWPVIGFLTRAVGTLFINRELAREVVRLNHLLRAAWERGEGIIFFPEGTSSAGAEIRPFKSPLLHVAAENHYPVSYASLSYRTPAGEPPAHLAVCWWGDMTFPDHFFNVLQLPRFEALLTFGDAAVRATDRKLLARRLHRLIAQQFHPVVRPEELPAARQQSAT
ncbi:1-acyl-sn-glycerol-3-phosphate acyltransferase [bacterium]|nr:1-acyl-sn-glycerol-3-phosphate acyltransferase [bacterium]